MRRAETRRLAALIGAAALDALVKARGGRRVYVPKRVRPGGALAAIVGVEAARALARACGGTELQVPRGWGREAYALGLLAAGKSVAEVAEAVWATERWVYRIKARQGAGAPGAAPRG